MGNHSPQNYHSLSWNNCSNLYGKKKSTLICSDKMQLMATPILWVFMCFKKLSAIKQCFADAKS